MNAISDTKDFEYTRRLIRFQSSGWKRWVDVQAPYRWHIRRLRPGFVLEIGCGIGRNLLHLNGNGVGVDHNVHSVGYCRELGLTALTPDEYVTSQYAQGRLFDSLLLSHVAEHMTAPEVADLIRTFLPNVRHGGRVIVITPQEAGFRSDASHVEFMDHEKVRSILEELSVDTTSAYSFPLPRPVGKVFLYNEFITVGRCP